MYVCIYIICTRIFIFMCIYMYIRIFIFMCIYIYIFMYAYTMMYICIFKIVDIDIRIYTYIPTGLSIVSD